MALINPKTGKPYFSLFDLPSTRTGGETTVPTLFPDINKSLLTKNTISDTTSQYIQDPNNSTASILNPNYKTPPTKMPIGGGVKGGITGGGTTPQLDITGIQKTITDLQTQATGLQKSLTDFMNQPQTGTEGTGTEGTDETDYEKTQKSIFDKILEQLPDIQAEQKTLMEKYETRAKAAEEASTKTAGVIESRYGTAIEEEKEAGQKQLTAEQESRRGFATNSALMTQIQDQSDKRVRNLSQQRDDALATNNVAMADKLDSLLEQEQTAITNSRVNYLNSLFAISGEMRAQAGFETPTQTRAAEQQKSLQNTLDALKLKYADLPEIQNVKSISGAVSILGPRLNENRKQELYKADLENKKTEMGILLDQKKLAEPTTDWTKIIGTEADWRKEYQGRDVIKQYNDSSVQYKKMVNAYNRVLKDSSLPKGPVDQALIMIFNKILDPRSVVRESEFALTANGEAIINRAEKFKGQLIEGARVTPALRAEIVNTAATLFNVHQEMKNEIDREFQALGLSANKRGVSININNIIGGDWEYIP